MTDKRRILGIDPGSRLTGFGVLDFSGDRPSYVASGTIRSHDGDFAERLRQIFDSVGDIVAEYRPDTVVIESVFMHKNAGSALKLGHARGVAMLAGVIQSLPVYEYTPAQVKQAVTGKGNAAKAQVQHMMKVLMGLSALPSSDAADALAVALCHGHTRATERHIDDQRRRAESR